MSGRIGGNLKPNCSIWSLLSSTLTSPVNLQLFSRRRPHDWWISGERIYSSFLAGKKEQQWKRRPEFNSSSILSTGIIRPKVCHYLYSYNKYYFSTTYILSRCIVRITLFLSISSKLFFVFLPDEIFLENIWFFPFSKNEKTLAPFLRLIINLFSEKKNILLFA